MLVWVVAHATVTLWYASAICIAGNHKDCPYTLIDHVDASDDSSMCMADHRVGAFLVGTRDDRPLMIH
jgi:hypothetical protein